MKRKSLISMGFLLVVLLMASLACGGKDEPTPTPVPTSTPRPAPTALPSESPPTATPTPPPMPEAAHEMLAAESEVHGVRLCYPDGWFYEDSFFIILSSDPDFDLFAAEEEPPDGVVMLIMAGSAEDMEAEEFTEEGFTSFAEEFGGEEVELLGGFEESTINGADVKKAEFRGVQEDTPVRGLVAMYVKDERAAVAVGLSPVELWEENAATVDAILTCIELFEGSGFGFDMDEEEVPVWYGALSYGETVQDSLVGGETQSWTFSGSAGELVSIILTPLGDEMDLSLRLLDPDGEELIDLDDAFGGEAESLSAFKLPADGQYSVYIKEFWDEPGEYELALQTGGDSKESEPIASGDMVAAESEILGVRLSYPDGWYYDDSFLLILASDASTLMSMEDDASELDGFIGIVIPFSPEEMEGESFEGMFDQMGDMFGASEDGEVEMVGPPTVTTINGADVQLVEFFFVKADQTTRAKFGIFNNGEQSAVVMVLGPDAQWDENAYLVDAIIESIELFEGSGLNFGEMPSTEAVYRGSLVYGTLIEDEFEGGDTHLWAFEGSADDFVSVIVNPLNEEMDVTIELLAADSTTLVEVDGGFSGEAEVLQDYQLPADGEYQIVIGEYWDVAASYELELIGSDEPVGALVPPGALEMGNVTIGEPISAMLMKSQDHVWTLPAKGGEMANIAVTPLDDEIDVAVSVIAPDGSVLVDELDDAFSGGTEELSELQLEIAGDYLIIVSEYWGSEGSYELAVNLNATE